MDANGSHAAGSWFGSCGCLACIIQLRKHSVRCLIEDAWCWTKVGDTFSRFKRFHAFGRRNRLGSIGRERGGFFHFRMFEVSLACVLKDRILWINNEFAIVARQSRVSALRNSPWDHRTLSIHALDLKCIWRSWRHLRSRSWLFGPTCLIFLPSLAFWHLILLWPHLC